MLSPLQFKLKKKKEIPKGCCLVRDNTETFSGNTEEQGLNTRFNNKEGKEEASTLIRKRGAEPP